MKAPHRLLALGLLCLLPPTIASAQAPSLSPIVDVTLNANATATINVVAVDVDGRQITLSPALPSFATLNSPTIGVGSVVTTLTLAPADIHVGSYVGSVTATAGGASDTEIFHITVNPAGSPLPPVVTAPALQEVVEGSSLGFSVDVTDPDAVGIASLEASMLPGGAGFEPDPTNTSGAFSWTPGLGDAGEYDVTFVATGQDGLSGGAVTHIRVAPAPTLMVDPIDDVTVEGGDVVSVAVNASGLPNATINLTASLPTFAMLNPPGSGVGTVHTTIMISPPTGSAGTYHASVTAASEGDFVTEPFDIIVTGTGGPDNNAPVLTAPPLETVAVGSTLSFDVTAVDPDGDHVDMFGSGIPPGSSFTDHGDDSGTFTWTPVAGQGGSHVASFSGLDNRGGSGAASTLILVTNDPAENQPPTLSAPATEHVDEGVLLSFQVTATDPDGDPVSLTADGVPQGATFVDQGNNTGLLTWTPDSTQSGTYEVVFTGDDGRGGSGTASTIITVSDVVLVGDCTISGDLEVCAGSTTELCGPADATSYAWTGPDGFTADTPCVNVGVEGSYELTVVDAEGLTSTCSATVTVMACDQRRCPRGPGFWIAQCAQRGNGSTKFDRAQMDAITACIDATSDFFDWSDDFEGFYAVVDPPRPMNVRKQALLKYAVLLANVCTGELGLVTSNGERIGLDPATEIHCDREGAATVAALMSKAQMQLVELDGLALSHDVKAAYEQLVACMDAIDKGIHGCGCGQHTGSDSGGDQGSGDHDGGSSGDDQGGGSGDDQSGDTGGSQSGDTGGSQSGDTGGSQSGDTGGSQSGDTGSSQNGDANGSSIDASGSSHPGAGLNVSIGPNPLNPSTDISFVTSRDGRLRVAIYDVKGRLVNILMDEVHASGPQEVRWDGTDVHDQTVPSGVYFIRIQTPQDAVTRRVAVVK